MDLGYGPTETTDGLNLSVEEIETSRIISRIFSLRS